MKDSMTNSIPLLMRNGGVCLLVSIYIIVKAGIFITELIGTYQMVADGIVIMVLVLCGLVLSAQYFERPYVGLAGRSESYNIYDYIAGAIVFKRKQNLDPTTKNRPLWRIDYPETSKNNPRHPLYQTYCKDCDDYILVDADRPPRVRHCDFCNKCRVAFDHHCDFVNACIDETNYPAFWCFLLWSWSALTASVLLDIHTLMIFCSTNYLKVTSDADAVLKHHLHILVSEPVSENIMSLSGGHILIIAFNAIVGLIISGFILKLLVLQTFNLLNNTTTPESVKYGHIGCVSPFDFRRESNAPYIISTYLNVRHRIWRGPLSGRPISCLKHTNSKGLHFWLHLMIEVVHTTACYVIPQYWNLSGEAAAHASMSVLPKHCTVDNLPEWELALWRAGRETKRVNAWFNLSFLFL